MITRRKLDPKLARPATNVMVGSAATAATAQGYIPITSSSRVTAGQILLHNLLTLCNCCHIEGVHGGRLEIEVVELLPEDLVVTFTRKLGWIPK